MLESSVCVLKDPWTHSSFLTYYGSLLLADKGRVMLSISNLCPVKIVGVKVLFAVDTREVSGKG